MQQFWAGVALTVIGAGVQHVVPKGWSKPFGWLCILGGFGIFAHLLAQVLVWSWLPYIYWPGAAIVVARVAKDSRPSVLTTGEFHLSWPTRAVDSGHVVRLDVLNSGPAAIRDVRAELLEIEPRSERWYPPLPVPMLRHDEALQAPFKITDDLAAGRSLHYELLYRSTKGLVELYFAHDGGRLHLSQSHVILTIRVTGEGARPVTHRIRCDFSEPDLQFYDCDSRGMMPSTSR